MFKFTFTDASDYTVVWADTKAEAWALARTKLAGRITLQSWN